MLARALFAGVARVDGAVRRPLAILNRLFNLKDSNVRTGGNRELRDGTESRWLQLTDESLRDSDWPAMGQVVISS